MPRKHPWVQDVTYSYAIYDSTYSMGRNTVAVKFGKTVNPPEERLDQLQTGSFGILVLAARSVTITEEQLHEKYWKYNFHDEWFELPVELFKEVVKTMNDSMIEWAERERLASMGKKESGRDQNEADKVANYTDITQSELIQVSKDGLLLSNIHEDRRCLEICHVAVLENPMALEFVPKELQNWLMCLKAVSREGLSLQFIRTDLAVEHSIVRKAIGNTGWALKFVPPQFITKGLCKMALKTQPGSIQYFPEVFKTLEMFQMAVMEDTTVIKYAPNHFIVQLLELISTKDFIDLDDIPRELLNLEICHRAIICNTYQLSSVPDNFMTPELCLMAVSINPDALEYIPVSKRTLELCQLAISKNSDSIRYAPEDIRQHLKSAIIS